LNRAENFSGGQRRKNSNAPALVNFQPKRIAANTAVAKGNLVGAINSAGALHKQNLIIDATFHRAMRAGSRQLAGNFRRANACFGAFDFEWRH